MIFRICCDFHRHTARKRNFCLVGNKTRRGDDDFVIRIQYCGENKVEGFGDSYCNHNFGLGKVLNLIEAFKMVANRLPQLEQSVIGGVVSFTPPQGFNARLDDGFGCVKIGLPNPQ